VLFVVIAAYSSRMTWDYKNYDQDRAEQRYETLNKVRQAEQALLNPVNPSDPKGPPTAEWVNQDKGVIRIPIEEAMAREIDTLKAQPAGAGAEIPVAVPPAPAKAAPGSPPPATGATNAAPTAQPPAAGVTNAAPAKPAKSAKPAAKPGAAPVTPPPVPAPKNT